jgi:phospholipid/cholesterol/gamma-HCH transport system substrate-binding protein
MLTRLNDVLGEQNRQNFAAAVADLRQLADAFARRAGDVDRTLQNLAAASDDLPKITRRLDRVLDDAGATLSVARGTLTTIDQLVDSEGRTAVGSAGKLMTELSEILHDNREAIQGFTGDGLVEFRRFLEEARQLVGNLNRVATRIGEDPSQVIFGARETEIKPEAGK